MNFKEAIYTNYIRYHNSHITESASLAKFKRQFSANNFYFGNFLPRDKNAIILEIGCGDGNIMYWLKENGYPNARGIDLSQEQVDAGKLLGIYNIEVADLKTYLETNHNFDLILAKDVFEHFTRQEFFDTLIKIRKSLTTTGTLVIQVINGQGIFYTSHFFADVTHEMAYTEKSLRQLILAAGFNHIEVYPVNPMPHGIKGMIRSILWKFKVATHKFWKAAEYGAGSGIFTSNIIAVIH